MINVQLRSVSDREILAILDNHWPIGWRRMRLIVRNSYGVASRPQRWRDAVQLAWISLLRDDQVTIMLEEEYETCVQINR